MIKKFTWCKEIDTDMMQRIVDEMKKLFIAFYKKEIPSFRYSLDELLYYCKSLIEGQRNDIEGIKPYSWSVAPTAVGMPSDARVDFNMNPTYLAVATLTLFLKRYPKEAEKIPNYREVLNHGILFATYRGLQGHGIEAEDEMLSAINIMHKGEVFRYVEEHPEDCPEMMKIYRECIQEMKAYIKNPRISWGGDYSSSYKSVLEKLGHPAPEPVYTYIEWEKAEKMIFEKHQTGSPARNKKREYGNIISTDHICTTSPVSDKGFLIEGKILNQIQQIEIPFYMIKDCFEMMCNPKGLNRDMLVEKYEHLGDLLNTYFYTIGFMFVKADLAENSGNFVLKDQWFTITYPEE